MDAVIHTATCYGRNGEKASEIFQANLVLPLRLLEMAAQYNTDTFFNSDTILNKYLNEYALSKNYFLELGKLFSKSKKIRFVNIRLEHIYGPDDNVSKFTTHVIKSCLANVAELKLTLGEQKRDFVYIDDVVTAYEVLLEKAGSQAELFQEYAVGSGNAITIREFVETVHRITMSRSKLAFGALPYRPGEVMYSGANIEPLFNLGWSCKTSLERGLKLVIRNCT